MVDLLTNQKLTWKLRSMGDDDDGRTFESKTLDQSDEPELLQEVHEARAALIEQVDAAIFADDHRSSSCFVSFSSDCLCLSSHRSPTWTTSLLNCCSQTSAMISTPSLQSK